MSSFALKLCAIIGMTLCHIGIIFANNLPFLAQCICAACGGVTFPIMAYMIAQGYKYTSSVKRYAARLFLCACVSQIPFSLAFEPTVLQTGEASIVFPFTGNVIFTLLLGLVLIYMYDHMKNRLVYWASCIAAVGASVVLDWGVLGPVMILMVHILPDEAQQKGLPILTSAISMGLPALLSFMGGEISQLLQVLYAFVGGGIAYVLLKAYNNKKGPRMKYFFYVYYPLHIAILYILFALYV